MKALDHLVFLHSVLRYRWRTERDDIAFLLKQDLAGGVMIDVGANRGLYTWWGSRRVGPRGLVLSFEPQPEGVLALNDLKASYRLHNVEVIGKGLGSQPGRTTLYRLAPLSGGATVMREESGWDRIEIDIGTLDDEWDLRKSLAGDRAVRLIKCDVEGFEKEVFAGATRLIAAHRPWILTECHHDDALKGALFDHLSGLGYDGFFFSHGRRFPLAQFRDVPYRKEGELHRNYWFVPKEAAR